MQDDSAKQECNETLAAPLGDTLPISKLRNPSLKEAIAELRWSLAPASTPGLLIDPHYKLLPGKIATALEEDYPWIDELSSAEMPEEIAAYTVQYQFRTSEEGFPLVQLGPGIITLNQLGKDYEWDDFERRINKVFSTLRSVHPNGKQLKPTLLLLRYIDAFSCKDATDNVLSFLRDKLKTTILLDKEILGKIGVTSEPTGLDFRAAYPLADSGNSLRFRFGTGKVDEEPALVLETVVQLEGRSVPTDQREILDWFAKAHEITHKWFFAIVEGELLEDMR